MLPTRCAKGASFLLSQETKVTPKSAAYIFKEEIAMLRVDF